MAGVFEVEAWGWAAANGVVIRQRVPRGTSSAPRCWIAHRGERDTYRRLRLFKPVTGPMIAQVGTISANDDEGIGRSSPKRWRGSAKTPTNHVVQLGTPSKPPRVIQ